MYYYKFFNEDTLAYIQSASIELPAECGGILIEKQEYEELTSLIEAQQREIKRQRLEQIEAKKLNIEVVERNQLIEIQEDDLSSLEEEKKEE